MRLESRLPWRLGLASTVVPRIRGSAPASVGLGSPQPVPPAQGAVGDQQPSPLLILRGLMKKPQGSHVALGEVVAAYPSRRVLPVGVLGEEADSICHPGSEQRTLSGDAAVHGFLGY